MVGKTSSMSRARRKPGIVFVVLLAFLLPAWLDGVHAMRPARVAKLRREAVDMFYHGYDNYMEIAFPEDEVCLKPTANLCRIAHLLTTSI